MPVADREIIDVEEPVIKAIRAGDRQTFAEFVRRHKGWVRGVIYGVLGDADRIDDVAQQVWTTVWQRVGELRDSKRWRPWLYRLARNAATDAGRDTTRRRDRALKSASVLGWAASESTPDRELLAGERRRAVLEAIEALPILYREPFVMRHVTGWSYAEIAEVLDMPVDSVETRLVRARRLLRERLKDTVL